MKTETHSLTCSIPPNILVGYLDVIKEGLKTSIASMEENQALNQIAFMLLPDNVKQAPPEMTPIICQFQAGLEQMLICRDTLMAIEGIALLIRGNLAARNGIGAELQYTTAAFAADMMSHELSMDNDSI